MPRRAPWKVKSSFLVNFQKVEMIPYLDYFSRGVMYIIWLHFCNGAFISYKTCVSYQNMVPPWSFTQSITGRHSIVYKSLYGANINIVWISSHRCHSYGSFFTIFTCKTIAWNFKSLFILLACLLSNSMNHSLPSYLVSYIEHMSNMTVVRGWFDSLWGVKINIYQSDALSLLKTDPILSANIGLIINNTK